MGSSESVLNPQVEWWKKDADAWIEVQGEEEFDEQINSGDKLVFVDFYATWCQGCLRSYPELCKLAKDPAILKSFKFVKACVDSNRALSRNKGVKGLPHVQVYDPKTGRLLVGIDIAPRKCRFLRRNLQLILDHPEASFKTDPNGFVIPIDKSRAENAISASDQAEQLHQFGESLYQKLMGTASASIGRKGHNGHVKSNAPRTSSSDEHIPAHYAREATRRSSSDDVDAEHEQYLEKATFCMQNKTEYGYDGRIDSLYQREVACRMKAGEHYMDYTGSSVYCQSQIDAVADDLKSHMYGNPHSFNSSSLLTLGKVDDARDMVLKFFNANPTEYQVFFTRGATASLKIIGETFPWSEASLFRYLRENHNSVLGIREYTIRQGGQFEAVDESFVESWLAKSSEPHDLSPAGGAGDIQYSLFAFPAEDNFAGVKYPLSWVERVKAKSTKFHRWKVALDAAAYVPTQPLDLSSVPVDFVALSFYKMFGFPTGLGALIVRVDASDILEKVFWGGGTVSLATSSKHFHVLKCRPSDRLEDGSVAFLDIIALKHGFQLFEKLGGILRVQVHVACLTEYLYRQFVLLKHSNGSPLIKIYGKHNAPDSRMRQGGILNFVLLSQNGHPLSYKSFEREASKAGFHIRVGAECNPGACYSYLGIEDQEVASLAGTKEGCHDDVEFIKVERSVMSQQSKALGSVDILDTVSTSSVDLGHPAVVALEWKEVPLGTIRVSLGYLSTFEDCQAMVQFLRTKYIDRTEW